LLIVAVNSISLDQQERESIPPNEMQASLSEEGSQL
jgi:hypothetical protein